MEANISVHLHSLAPDASRFLFLSDINQAAWHRASLCLCHHSSSSLTLQPSVSPGLRHGFGTVNVTGFYVVRTTPNPKPGGLGTTIRLAPYPFTYLESTNLGLERVFPPPCDSISFQTSLLLSSDSSARTREDFKDKLRS